MEIFSKLLKISFRNIFRNKRRTFLTLSILALGSTGLIFVGGFLEGLDLSYREQFIHTQTGHLQINQKGYFKKGVSEPFQYLLKDYPKVQKVLAEIPSVMFSVPRLKFSGMASSPNTSVAVLAVGVDPEAETRMTRHRYSAKNQGSAEKITGEPLDPQDAYGVLLGKGLLEALGLKIGDTVQFILTRPGGSLDGAEFTIRGTFETIVKDFDDRALKINLKTAQKLLGLDQELHSLLIILDDSQNVSAVEALLQKKFQAQELPVEVLTWEQQGEFYRHGKELLYRIFHTVQLIIAIVFFFSIANTLNMALFERMREFGTMMALGNQRSVIFSVVVLEALILGLLGSVLGLGLGVVFSNIFSTIGIVMPPIPGSASGYIATIQTPAKLLFETFLIAFGSTFFASLVPGFRISHTRIVQALGYV